MFDGVLTEPCLCRLFSPDGADFLQAPRNTPDDNKWVLRTTSSENSGAIIYGSI